MRYIETDRLVLRDWTEDDLEAFKDMNKDPKVMEYFPSTLTEQETEKFYRRIQDELAIEGYGLFAVETKQDRAFVGYIGLHEATFEADFTPCVEVGFRLRKEAWDYGYATEGAKACIDYGHELGIENIYSFTAAVNERSRRVMEKAGMQFVKQFDHPALEEGHHLRRHVLYRG
ncbi:GNAT family N-acetyltransferase [Salimicrobium halophilum]|uniref:Ribosomal-protein-alanine N-acetyltransferase n=1 Tax=Salimicrobium halophilum TaxID=86666 RepID=A0A1G8T9D0_9BACI|nr:GNAT family N-acetyltransferase [Salimicrobium halophilum]SDJ38103.1 ribosomal-protein-alanine N-acetyltransferase [Salimicrobium halophilum]